MLLYGGVGIVLLTVVALGTCRVFLGMGIQEQLAAHNVAAAIVVAGVYIATSLTYSGTLSGEGGGFWILLIFFLLGQLALLGITYAFRWLTSYDDVQEIAAGNVAAALALTGLLIAVGLIVRWAVAGHTPVSSVPLGGFCWRCCWRWCFTPCVKCSCSGFSWEALCTGVTVCWTVKSRTIKTSLPGSWKRSAYVTAALFLTNIV